MTEKLAVLDLGTNTFHLLILEFQDDGQFIEHFRERRFIKLAENGIQKIGPAPFQRAVETMQDFSKILIDQKVSRTFAFGTAALRTASNGAQLADTILEKTGIQVAIIDGDREASLIHQGVQLAVPFDQQNRLIMDIGGGSVEFIIANKDEVQWAESFPIGVAILYKAFHQSEPISTPEQSDLVEFINEKLGSLKAALIKFPCEDLVGASGTFDVIENLLAKGKAGPHHAFVAADQLKILKDKVLPATLEQRRNMPGVPLDRSDMIVVAVLLIEYIIQLAQIKRIIVSEFALKEGVLAELRKK
ncbi:MAG: hypothetical protein AAF242_16740 [Bacteroidota bacterium]